MSLLDIVIIVMALANIIFAGLLYFHGSRKATEVSYAFIAIFVSLWSLAVLLMTSSGASEQMFRFGARLHYVAGNLGYLSFFWFTLVYPARRVRSFVFPILLSAVDFLLLFLVVTTPFLLHSVQIFEELDRRLIFNPAGYGMFTVFLSVVFLLSEGILGAQWIRTQGIQRLRIGYLILGTLLAGSLGIFVNLILPWLGKFTLFAVGPFFVTAAFIGMSLYLLLRHHLFPVRIIATEVLTGSILVILFGEILVASSVGEWILRVLIFLLASVFGYLLIRSVLREVWQREKLQKLTLALETANEDLKRLDKARREFVSIASHQLRTPLSAIKGFVSMILEGSYGKVITKTKTALEKVYQSNERLIKLVNDLLDLSRIEAGRMQYAFAQVRFDEMVASVADELKLKADEKKLRLTYTRPREALPSVWADPTKLRQVVMNLVDNAIKYTPEGTVTITLKRVGNEARLDVKDTGVGLEPEEKEHLFHMFHRGAGGQMYHTEGTGLGLYIAKKIIEDHKGRIEVSSPGKGKGSTFSIILPLSES